MKQFDFVANEHAVLKHWDEIKILDKIIEKNKGGERFRSLDGPITANAPMGIHHAWSRTLKDSQIKYNVLKGRTNPFQSGFDAQGMWVEVEVEKELGLKSKKDIEKYGLANFTEKCIERVKKYSKVQTGQSIRLGQIMDWENSYFTNSDHNIESIWNFLKVVSDKGWLKQSHKCMPWCPRCGTSLSEHEMSGSYKQVKHDAVFVKLGIGTEHLLIWTTTPWTLVANRAVAVNPDNMYLRVKVGPDVIIVGKEAIKVLGKDIKVLSEFKGSELVGKKYTRPLSDGQGVIIPWADVSAQEGSGLVHIAPGCGAEDFRLGVEFGLEQIVPVDEAGIFTAEFGDLVGLDTESAKPKIFEKLTAMGQMFKTHEYSHNYPFCWRCKTDVLFRLVKGWDIATAQVKPAIFKAIKTVKWHPGFLQKNMEQWITQMGDWNISRRRFYGLPLPFYPCDCGHVTVVASKKELKSKSVKWIEPPHLHRPYIDEIQIKCDKCSRPVSRVADVGDCWLDAGITPFSTKAVHPSEVVIEMKEQIRLWFYAQLFMSVVLTGKAPYENVVGFGTMLDETGKKFSKTGFHIPFDQAAESFGADAIRYNCASANPTHDMLFGPSMITEVKRKLLGIINAVSFWTTYSNIDKPDVKKHKPANLHLTDIWLIETMNKFVLDADAAYSNYQMFQIPFHEEKFIEDLSNFYIRTNRRRFWKGEQGVDKLNAYWALHRALTSIVIVLTPITPFLCEYLNKQLNPDETSVLLSGFPKPLKGDWKAPGIIDQVTFIQGVTSLAHKLRATEDIKVRQPLSTLFIKTKNSQAIKMFEDYLKEELNIKQIKIVQDEAQFNEPFLVVNFREAGKVLGKGAQDLKAKIEGLDYKKQQAIAKKYPENLFERKLRSKPEYVSVTEGDQTVVLDTTLTPGLIEEGKLREIIRQIQVARQEAGLEITQRIKLTLKAKDKSIIEKHKQKIMDEVLASDLVDTGGDLMVEVN